MAPDYGFFNVDTQEPNAHGSALCCQKLAAPITPALHALSDHAAANDVLTVATACLNVCGVRDSLPTGALYIAVDAPMPTHLNGCRHIFLEKKTCGSAEENTRQRAFDIFSANPNAGRLLELLGLRHWYIFGRSTEFCITAVAEGLLNRKYEVTIFRDACLPGGSNGTETTKSSALERLAKLGARIASASEFLHRG